MYTNGEKTISGKRLVVDGRLVLNPTEAQLSAAGFTKVVPQPSPSVTKEGRIWELKDELQASDYKAIKFAEGWLTAEEYAPIKAERQALRDEINRIEAMSEEEFQNEFKEE